MIMKSSDNAISPFIVLLIPILFMTCLLTLNADSRETVRTDAAACFKLPEFRVVLRSVF